MALFFFRKRLTTASAGPNRVAVGPAIQAVRPHLSVSRMAIMKYKLIALGVFASLMKLNAQTTVPPEKGMKQIAPNRFVTTEPLELYVWKSDSPIAPEVLASLSSIAKRAGATEVYWFAMRIGKGQSHLGLGIAPVNQEMFGQIGKEFEQIWREYSPKSPTFDILPLDGGPAAKTIRSTGTKLLLGGF